MARPRDRGSRARGWTAVALLGVVMCATAAAGHAAQRTFHTPQQAAAALVAATRSGSAVMLSQILGRAGTALIDSGDPVADHAARARFVAAYERQHRIEREGADEAVLIVGEANWPMPIPLLHTSSGWRFDTAAGRKEILDRRIGRDELAVIEVCRAYVHAQREYAALSAHPGSAARYALHFMSREGERDGLYWPARAGEPQSPLGPLIAQARAAGYAPGGGHGRPHPYYGYYFRILTSQGPHAPGGAHSYLVGGKMTGGFALLAYPAKYGDSGIMTFMVNQAGIVFQKNLGLRTARIASKIVRYDPDESWTAP